MTMDDKQAIIGYSEILGITFKVGHLIPYFNEIEILYL